MSKQITQNEIARRAHREEIGAAGLTGRALEMGRGYPRWKLSRTRRTGGGA